MKTNQAHIGNEEAQQLKIQVPHFSKVQKTKKTTVKYQPTKSFL